MSGRACDKKSTLKIKRVVSAVDDISKGLPIPDILYHYCSTEAFHSIVTNKTLRMSSLTMSNDSMEGRWAIEVASQVAKKLLSPLYAERVIPSIKNLAELVNCVGLCLSEKRDLLSQWRGYANNGSGVCIGISSASLIALRGENAKIGNSISISKILYDKTIQEDLIRGVFEANREYLENPDLVATGLSILWSVPGETQEGIESKWRKAGFQLSMALFGLFEYLFVLKSHAFYEEEEWRVLRFVISEDYRGYKFAPRQNAIVPYVDINCEDCAKPFIKEVILGPKNETPIPVMKGFLKENGFPDVDIVKSAATYR